MENFACNGPAGLLHIDLLTNHHSQNHAAVELSIRQGVRQRWPCVFEFLIELLEWYPILNLICPSTVMLKISTLSPVTGTCAYAGIPLVFVIVVSQNVPSHLSDHLQKGLELLRRLRYEWLAKLQVLEEITNSISPI